MKKIRFCMAIAMLASAAAYAQGFTPTPQNSAPQPAKKKPPKKLGVSKDDGHGRSIANDQQQIQSDKFQMRQDQQNKDSRKVDRDSRQMQRDNEQLNRDTTRR